MREYTIEGSSSGFGLHSSTDLEHGLGYSDAPLYTIVQPFIPDHQLLEVSAADTGRAAAHSDLEQLLPDGRYLVVPAARPLTTISKILLANTWVAAPATARGLLQPDEGLRGCIAVGQIRVFCCAFGAGSTTPPVADRPLIGLTVLEYTGQDSPIAVLLFDCGLQGDPALVIPVEGSMVINNMGDSRWPGVQWEERWAEQYAARFAEALAKLPTR